MIIYLIESDLHKIAFSDAAPAVNLAIKLVEQEKAKGPRREIFSDYGGPALLSVDYFDPHAVTAYVEVMKVNRKVILQIRYPKDDLTRAVTINKLILEE